MSTLTRQEARAQPTPPRESGIRIAGLCLVAALIFALDVTTPLGFVAPVLYVFLLCSSLQRAHAVRPAFVAAVCTLLTIAGALCAPTSDIAQWAGIMNRVMVVAALWALVAVAARYDAHHRIAEESVNYARQLRSLSRRLVDAEEDERHGLTRELHDRVGQSLAALNLVLHRLAVELPENAPADTRLCVTESLQLVEATAESIEHVMEDLRPPWLEEYGLLAALHWHAARFGERTRIATSVTGEEPVPRLRREVEMGLFRITQEAITNIARHARTSDATIELRQDEAGGTVTLTVADEGVGFDTAPAPGHSDPPWGLLGMRERAQAIDATLRIESQPGAGTTVTVVVEHRP